MPYQTTTTRRGANHTLHLVLTICTCGMWAFTGWPIAAIMGRRTKQKTWVQPVQQYPQQQPYPHPPQQYPYGPPPQGSQQQPGEEQPRA